MSDLKFQDFNVNIGPESVNSTNTEYRPAGQIGDNDRLFTDSRGNRGSSGNQGGGPRKNFFSFEYYQKFFDVDTDQVFSRVLNSMVPKLGSNFITEHIQPFPDLYGPFWVSVTLVFATAICGNLAKYIETAGDVSNHQYSSDFRLVTGASTLIACYVILIPFALYSLFWYRKVELQYSYLEILCAYGYSLSIFVPVSVLWVVHAQWFRWFLIIISVILSGAVIVGSIWPALKTDRSRALSFGIIFCVLLVHTLLAIGFKEFYFDAAQPPRSGQDLVVPPELPTIQKLPEVMNQSAGVKSLKLTNDAKDPKAVAQVLENRTVLSAETKIETDNGSERPKRSGATVKRFKRI